jgi:superfamily II DNA or RNA helicase
MMKPSVNSHFRHLHPLALQRGVSDSNVCVNMNCHEQTVLHGGIKAGDRETIAQEIQAGNVHVLICTSHLIGEGVDISRLESLFLTTPIRFSGRLIQYVGRILRPSPGKDRAIIHDYVDIYVGVLEASARARQAEYERQGITAA